MAMTFSTTTDRAQYLAAACPLCGGRVEETPATAVDLYYGGNRTLDAGPREVLRETIVAACAGCEFLVDLRAPNGRHLTSDELLVEVGRLVEGGRHGARHS